MILSVHNHSMVFLKKKKKKNKRRKEINYSNDIFPTISTMPKKRVEFLKRCLTDLVLEYKHLKCDNGNINKKFEKSTDIVEEDCHSNKENSIYNNKNNLEKPITTHKCTLCGREGKFVKFATKNDLNEHIQNCNTLTDSLTQTCDECKKDS